MSSDRRSVVLLSGGLLSAIALELAVRETEVAVALHFAGGQAGGEEYRAATRLAKAHNLLLEVATPPSVIAGDMGQREPGLYGLLVTMGAFYAGRVGAHELWTGVTHRAIGDRPDASVLVLRAAGELAGQAHGRTLRILHNPALDRTAAFRTAAELGQLDRLVEDTTSCHGGARAAGRSGPHAHGQVPGKRYPWGHGCGACPGCDARAAAWQAFERSQGIVE
jgi:7-cyano-7-deazaguanine synthase in queuosine biosynthesis